METQRFYTHCTLVLAWLINTITPTGIGIALAGTASVAAIVSYIQQTIYRKRQEKRDKILFDKQMKLFEEQDKVKNK